MYLSSLGLMRIFSPTLMNGGTITTTPLLSLAGLGLLLAVPLAAIAGVLTRYALKKYQESSLYLGTTTPSREAIAADTPIEAVEGTAAAPKPAARKTPSRRNKPAQ